MIALREAYRAGLLHRRHWPVNLLSGLIVGIVALPLAMAFAIASGAKPEQGLYTAIVAGFCVSAFGGSRVQIAGPTGAFIAILAGITAQYGVDGLQIATLMAGVILLALGFARMGAVIRFIPDPVILGFTAGIGVIIFVGQWASFLGLPAASGTHFHEKFWHLLHSLPQAHLGTAAIGVLSLLLALFGQKMLRRIPGPLLALVGATLFQALAGFEGVATIGSAFGGIPRGLPTLVWPDITGPRILELIGPAFAIAMLGAIESLLSAVVADEMAGTRHSSNQELIGQGIANVLAPLVGGFAATGAIARTATNVRNGGNSPLAGIVHAVTLLLIILVAAPLASAIPLATLAAILFVVAWNMSELHRVVAMLRRAPPADVLILVITFVLTVFADLVVAVNIGVVLATLHFLRRMASSVEFRPQTEAELQPELRHLGRTALPANTQIYLIEGPLFFGAVQSMERVLAGLHAPPAVFIVRLKSVPFMDITGLQALDEIIVQLQRRKVRVMLCEARLNVLRKLLRAGTLRLIGRAYYHRDFDDALRAAEQVPARGESGPSA